MSNEGWSCPTCTYYNAHGSFLTCEICGETKPPSAAAAAAKHDQSDSGWESESQVLAREREERIERERQALIQERMKEIMLMQQELWAEKEAEDRQRERQSTAFDGQLHQSNSFDDQRRQTAAFEEQRRQASAFEEQRRQAAALEEQRRKSIALEEQKERIRREEEQLREHQARVAREKQELELRLQEEELKEQQARLQRQREELKRRQQEELERRERENLTSSAKAMSYSAMHPPEPTSQYNRPNTTSGVAAAAGASARRPGASSVTGPGAASSSDEAQRKLERLEQERVQLQQQSVQGSSLHRPGATAVTGPGASSSRDVAQRKLDSLEQERAELANQVVTGSSLHRPGATAVTGPGAASSRDVAQRKFDSLEQERRQLENQTRPGATSYSGLPPERELEKLEQERRLLEQQQQRQRPEPRPGAVSVAGMGSSSNRDDTADRKLQSLEKERQQLEAQQKMKHQKEKESSSDWQEKWLQGEQFLDDDDGEEEQEQKMSPGEIPLDPSSPVAQSLWQFREESKAREAGNSLAMAISSSISQDQSSQLRLLMDAQREAQRLSIHEPGHVVSTQSPPPIRISTTSMESLRSMPLSLQLPASRTDAAIVNSLKTDAAIVTSPKASRDYDQLPSPSKTQLPSPSRRTDVSPNPRETMRASVTRTPPSTGSGNRTVDDHRSPSGGGNKEEPRSQPPANKEIERPIHNRSRSDGAHQHFADSARANPKPRFGSGLGGRRTSLFGRKKASKSSGSTDSEDEEIPLPPTNLTHSFETTHWDEGEHAQHDGRYSNVGQKMASGPEIPRRPGSASTSPHVQHQHRKTFAGPVRTKRLARDPKNQSVADLTIVSMDQLMDDDNPLWEKSAKKGAR